MPLLKQSNRGVGIGLLIVGLIFICINLYTITYEYFWLPKLLLVGIVVTTLGLALTIFPGANVPIENNKQFFKQKFSQTSWRDKLIWIFSILAGSTIAIWVIVYYDLPMT